MTATAATETFTSFVEFAEPRLRRALVVAYGEVDGREAVAEALAYAWEHWDRVQEMANPVGYLYRVGRTRGLLARRDSLGVGVRWVLLRSRCLTSRAACGGRGGWVGGVGLPLRGLGVALRVAIWGVALRRVCLLLLLVSLLSACGGDWGAGRVVVSDPSALAAYLIGVLEAESNLAAVTTPTLAATTTAEAADLAEEAVAAYADFAAAVAALAPPPEAEDNRATLISLAEDGTALSERLVEAVDSMDLQEISAIALDTLDLSIRGVDEVAERQALIAAVLAAHPERPLNQYLTAIGELWIPLTKDYHRLTSEAQRKLLAGDFSGAVEPYQELIDTFEGFLPEWDTVVAPVEAGEFHTWYREWAADGLDLIGLLLADLRDRDLTGLQGDLSQVATWATGWSEAILQRNAITIAALGNP